MDTKRIRFRINGETTQLGHSDFLTEFQAWKAQIARCIYEAKANIIADVTEAGNTLQCWFNLRNYIRKWIHWWRSLNSFGVELREAKFSLADWKSNVLITFGKSLFNDKCNCLDTSGMLSLSDYKRWMYEYGSWVHSIYDCCTDVLILHGSDYNS